MSPQMCGFMKRRKIMSHTASFPPLWQAAGYAAMTFVLALYALLFSTAGWEHIVFAGTFALATAHAAYEQYKLWAACEA